MKPGDEMWWVERGASRKPVHLTRVRVVGTVDWAPGVFVTSVRSGRRYNAEPEDLLTIQQVKIPKEPTR